LYYWSNEANYWQTRSIARPLRDSRATWSYPFRLTCTITWSPLEFLSIISTQTGKVPRLLEGAKILPKSSTLWVGCTNVTDRRQTTDDRQADSWCHKSRWISAIKHCFSSRNSPEACGLQCVTALDKLRLRSACRRRNAVNRRSQSPYLSGPVLTAAT